MSLAIMFAPFLNISAYADYEKFMNALEEVGYDVQGEEKKELTKADLMAKFAEIAGEDAESDKMLLS